jgi:hypothetical protein
MGRPLALSQGGPWVELDGSNRTIGISTIKAMAYQEVITTALSKSKITLQKLWEIQGKLYSLEHWFFPAALTGSGE